MYISVNALYAVGKHSSLVRLDCSTAPVQQRIRAYMRLMYFTGYAAKTFEARGTLPCLFCSQSDMQSDSVLGSGRNLYTIKQHMCATQALTVLYVSLTLSGIR